MINLNLMIIEIKMKYEKLEFISERVKLLILTPPLISFEFNTPAIAQKMTDSS